jgi:preprotein translocase subunit SecG
MIENKKVITWSLIVLFLTLSIVYSLTYQKKELIFKSTNKSENVYAQTQAEQWSNIDSKDSSKNTNNSVSMSD